MWRFGFTAEKNIKYNTIASKIRSIKKESCKQGSHRDGSIKENKYNTKITTIKEYNK